MAIRRNGSLCKQIERRDAMEQLDETGVLQLGSKGRAIFARFAAFCCEKLVSLVGEGL